MIIAGIDISDRINIESVKMICTLYNDNESFTKLINALKSDNKRVADNAAWILTHMPKKILYNLHKQQDYFINLTLQTQSLTQQRLLLNILLQQPFNKEALRSDFINFCLNTITDLNYPSGIRSLCFKLAYHQCKLYPELLNELHSIYQLMHYNSLEPALKAAHKYVGKKLLQHFK